MTEVVAPAPAAIREELESLRGSSAFARSASLFTLLRFIVDEVLEGRGATLKELVIGDALYGHQQPYDPRIDSTVRVEARRLRRKLTEYYDGDGAVRPVRIEMPVGGYRPLFRYASKQEQPAFLRTTAPVSAPVDLAVLPFRALSLDTADHCFADGLTDEVIFACAELPGLRVAPRIAIFQYSNRSYSLAEVACHLGVAMVLHGTIRADRDRSRVTVEIADPTGFVTWSDRLECGRCEGIEAQERLAAAIASRIPSTIVRRACRDEAARWAMTG